MPLAASQQSEFCLQPRDHVAIHWHTPVPRQTPEQQRAPPPVHAVPFSLQQEPPTQAKGLVVQQSPFFAQGLADREQHVLATHAEQHTLPPALHGVVPGGLQAELAVTEWDIEIQINETTTKSRFIWDSKRQRFRQRLLAQLPLSLGRWMWRREGRSPGPSMSWCCSLGHPP